MTEEELAKILDGEELLKKIDVKTLVIDLFMRHSTMDDLLAIFKERLPNLEDSYVKRFIYMKRN